MKRQDKNFLEQKMSIDTDWLETEFKSPYLVNSRPKLESFISNLISATRSQNPKEEITKNFKSVSASLYEGTKIYEVFDSLHHAFKSFVSNGLYDLHRYQEKEGWYPKIVLKSELKPNDISSLACPVEIYRGCDISEFIDKKYGQSWTTSKQIAEKFAFHHYKSQAWYSQSKRCVLKATVPKETIWFSDQSKCEKEIVVNIGKSNSVQKV